MGIAVIGLILFVVIVGGKRTEQAVAQRTGGPRRARLLIALVIVGALFALAKGGSH